MAGPVLLLRFDETLDAVRPSDALGNVDDLTTEAGLVMPTVVDAALGRGRRFLASAGRGVRAVDVVAGSTLLTRDASIQVALSWDLAAQAAAAQTGTLYARGKGTAAAEYVGAGLELRVVNAALGVGELRWLWHDVAGVLKTQVGGHFKPASTGVMLLTATRRWVATGQVVLRYFAGDVLLAEVTSADGSIGGGTTGTTSIGARFSGATWGRFFDGVIDELRVVDYELTPEEVAATWRRISVHQPAGYTLLRELHDEGFPISDDPSSRVQRETRQWGHGLGFAAAQAENIRDNILPDRAYGQVLESWEAITATPPKPGDSVEARRARVVARLKQRAGVSIPGIREALDEVLDTDGANLEILSFDNTQRDDFALGLRAERWRADPSAQWTISAGALRVQAAGAANILFNGPVRNWYTCLLAVDGTQRQLYGAPSCNAFLKVTPTTLPAGGEVGLVFWDWARLNAFFLGVRNNGGAIQVVSERFLAGVSQGVTVHDVTSLTAHWLQLRQDTTTIISDAHGGTLVNHTVRWSTTGPTTGFSQAALIQFSYCVDWIGMYARANVAALPGALDASFDDAAVRTPYGSRTFRSYVFRDPLLAGSPDIAAAQNAVNQIKHAHTTAGVITSKSLLADDPTTPSDIGPAGAL